eukprot:gnl/TRDRNA2_/TRDRNA2_169359_c0_seq1.p1 gnl/TRDRNA2_/TRDRNA2_169359_c0~~gnl/TRDRNA2_/TRDRNA2_169359_c0_seq1.p1  ORF type:complete len:704 (-),score=119.51 gnl/TRDRNA2_/TRDRNA2_169359_c0_seq1:103-2148(-)
MPPSATALKLLLEHYDPENVELFGTARYKSIEDFYDELVSRKSFFVKRSGSIQRYVEPAVLKLKWKGHLLMMTHEIKEGKKFAIERNRFLGTKTIHGETWQQAIMRTVATELDLPEEPFLRSLKPSAYSEAECHALLEESMLSPTYPGIFSHYTTHLVEWEICEDCLNLYSDGFGLPVNPLKRVGNPYGSDFSTKAANGRRTLFWRWVPETEAVRLQAVMHMCEATIDERWAKHAFRKDGIVQFPPSQSALVILLLRCGIDVRSFGSGGHRTLHALWTELSSQESYLQMNAGRPLLVVEATFVRIRWRPHQQHGEEAPPWQILVQLRQEFNGMVTENHKLVSTRKLKEESWDESALRCVCEDLCLTRQQVKSMLSHRTRDTSEYTYYEGPGERLETPRYPGLPCLHRAHLVSYTLKEDITNSPYGRAILGLRQEDDDLGRWSNKMRSNSTADLSKILGKKQPYEMNSCEDIDPSWQLQPGRRLTTHPEVGKRIDFVWMKEEDTMSVVHGVDLWLEAKKQEDRHRISSILVGLEGSAPNYKSPFGMEHGADGGSNKVSALGGRKWRAFRANGALQIPSDENGMHVQITKQSFKDLVNLCELLDLVDPSLDLISEPGKVPSRELLNRRYAEKELFKQVLGGNGQQAKQSLERMKQYRKCHRTPAQVYRAMHRSPSQTRQRSKP